MITDAQVQQSSNTLDITPIPDEFIVSFQRHLSFSDQVTQLSNLIGPPSLSTWTIIPRNNPATMFYNVSDFSLIRLFDSSLLEILKICPEWTIIPQKIIRQSLVQVDDANEDDVEPSPRSRKLLGIDMDSIPALLGADQLWKRGYTGQGVNVAVFDTGVTAPHPHFRNVVARWDFTDDDIVDDIIGHGTFVAGVIASQSTDCPGFAPDANIHSYRVFTSKKVSYTSWFLDALNHAIFAGIDVLNLSIGGPDFMDRPFVDKILEASANNIIVVSAIGNDGPLYGTLNNPGDQSDVIGVGGITFDHKMAPFSSRGMTTWELPHGYGRVKPDLVAYSESVSGSHVQGTCRTLSGTSVAAPVVTGAVALLVSTTKLSSRPNVINPASMKQILVEAAERLNPSNGGGNLFEQGFGALQLTDSWEILTNYKPRASLLPSSLDFTDCPFMWPYCVSPLFATSSPYIFNVTILNGMGVSGQVVVPPAWHPGKNGEHLLLNFETSPILWPYTGQLAVRIRVADSSRDFQGIAEGVVTLTVESPSMTGGMPARTELVLPIRVRIMPTPPRSKRILWDQYHNLRYPSGYFPRDALWVTNQPFDWNGDHLHTNFRDLFTHLVELGFHIDVLGEPFTCFDASLYGTLLIVDPEEEYFPEEILKIQEDVTKKGLSLLVFADWYNTDLIQKLKFFDENTRQWWTPATGGANVPAINDLLSPFGISFSDSVYDGDFMVGSKTAQFSSGNVIKSFPRGGRLLMANLANQGNQMLGESNSKKHAVAVLGLLTDVGLGRVAVYGDSNLIDSANQRKTAWWLAQSLFQFVSTGTVSADLKDTLVHLDPGYQSDEGDLPIRLPPSLSSLHLFSKVIDHPLPTCSVHDWEHDLPPPGALPYSFPEPRMYDPPLAGSKYPSHRGKAEESESISITVTFALIAAFIAICFTIFVLYKLNQRRRPIFTSIITPERPEP